MAQKILLIGGGEIKNGETEELDRMFIELAGGKQAVIGFFPTAAGDSQGYVATFQEYFGRLGCRKVLPIKLSEINIKELGRLLAEMTGIYLGGGDTELLVDTFKKKKVVELLKTALKKGVVIAGMSAGALATCDYYVDPDKKDSFKVVEGLGLQHHTICIVHYQPGEDQEILVYLKEKYPNYKIVGLQEKQGLLV